MTSIEEIRKKRMEEYRVRLEQFRSGANETQQREEEERAEQEELQKEMIIKKILDSDGRARLNSIRLANPQFAEQVISLLLYLYQNGQIKTQISDEQLKALLVKIKSKKKETRIIRK